MKQTPQTYEQQTGPIGDITGAQPPRLAKKTQQAIDILVTRGVTIRAAAREVGMNETALGRALKKPHIAKYYEQQKIIAIQDIKAMRKMGEVAAIHVAIDLMHNASSESVKARMVEFFAAKASPNGPQTTVNISNNVGSTGYEMVKPGQRVVDVVDVTPDEGHTDS